MSEADRSKTRWKEKLRHEVIAYWTNFVYLTCFFGAFAWYRRLILAEYHIHYLHYGIALIEAFVLAKVILVLDSLRLGRRHEDKPLIFSTLYKALLFTLCVEIFRLVESIIRSLIRGEGVAGGWAEYAGQGMDGLLAGCLITFCAFIPYFAFNELGRLLGEGRIWKLFFHRREDAEAHSH